MKEGLNCNTAPGKGCNGLRAITKVTATKGRFTGVFTIVILLLKCTDERKESVRQPVNVQKLQVASPWHSRYCSK